MSRNSRKSVIIISLCIIFAAVLAYIIYSAVSRKSTTEIYLDAESKNFERIVNKIEGYYASFVEKQKPYMEGPNRSRTEITADIKGA